MYCMDPYIIMEMNTTYIRTDDNKIVNENCIKWVKKMDECMNICTKSIGCGGFMGVEGTHKVCKTNNINSYTLLNKHFETE